MGAADPETNERHICGEAISSSGSEQPPAFLEQGGCVCGEPGAHWPWDMGRGRGQPLARKEQLWGIRGPRRGKGHFWAKLVSLKEEAVFQDLE